MIKAGYYAYMKESYKDCKQGTFDSKHLDKYKPKFKKKGKCLELFYQRTDRFCERGF